MIEHKLSSRLKISYLHECVSAQPRVRLRSTATSYPLDCDLDCARQTLGERTILVKQPFHPIAPSSRSTIVGTHQ